MAGAGVLTTADPAFASASSGERADVIADAKTYVGKTWADMNKVWGTGSKYSFAGDWCADFMSYLLRGTGTPFTRSSAALYGSLPHHSTPRAGDVIHYRGAETSGHVGLVISLSASGVASTIEGNAGTESSYRATHVKKYSSPWAPDEVVGYGRPTYT